MWLSTLKKALVYDFDNYLLIEYRAKEIISETITEDMSDLEKQVRLSTANTILL